MNNFANTIKNLLFIAVAAAGIMLLAPQTAHAQGCPPGHQEVSIPIDRDGTRCIPINEDSAELEDNPIIFYLRNILIFIFAGAGIGAVGGIVYGGFLYMTARANASQVQKGQEVIINTVVGILFFIFMYALSEFLVPGGVFL